MKKIFFTLTFFLSLSSLNSQIIIDKEFIFDVYPSSIKTYDFIVLDINTDKKLIAFKHVFCLLEVYNEMGEIYQKPAECNYTGMSKYPNAGVVLGTYNYEKGEYEKIYTIYNATYQQSECYTHQKSALMLDSAKQYFISQNLDITKLPKPVLVNQIDVFNFELTYNNNTFTVKSFDDYDTYITTSCLSANDILLFQINQKNLFSMASHGRISYLRAYHVNDEIIFLYNFYFINHFAGYSDQEYYNFTPSFKFKDLKKR